MKPTGDGPVRGDVMPEDVHAGADCSCVACGLAFAAVADALGALPDDDARRRVLRAVAYLFGLERMLSDEVT